MLPSSGLIALSIISALFLISLIPSSKLITPESTSAPYSPNESPKVYLAEIPLSSTALADASDVSKIAGCEYLVLFKSSSLPLKIISFIGIFKISSPISNISLHSSILSYKLFPMPTYCEPCPGKRNAIFSFIISSI